MYFKKLIGDKINVLAKGIPKNTAQEVTGMFYSTFFIKKENFSSVVLCSHNFSYFVEIASRNKAPIVLKFSGLVKNLLS